MQNISLNKTIEINYSKLENYWLCNSCNGEIYSGKKKYKLKCSCIAKEVQNNLYRNYLKNYYNVNGTQWNCKKCSIPIKGKREQHALRCKGFGTRDTKLTKIDPLLFSQTCDLGCGKKSHYFYKNGKAYCSKFASKCPIKVGNDRDKKVGVNPYIDRPHPKGMLGKTSHNKGLTKETSDVVARTVASFKKTILKQGCKNLGRNHTDEAKAKITAALNARYASGWEPVCGRAKKYKHSSPIAGDITVDGTWELAFAQILDKVNIKWERNRKRFKYTHLDGHISTYQPDFFVHTWNTYIEVKGYHTDLDTCKWQQFDEPLLIIKRSQINIIKKWLAEEKTISVEELFELIKNSTKKNNLNI